MRMLGAILAGGESRRMGRDKALVEVGGRALIGRVRDVLAAQAGSVIISGPSGVPDDARFAPGPLRGLLAVLDYGQAHGYDAVLTASTDIPFLPGDLAARLAPPPAIAASGGQLHYVVGLWPAVLAPDLERAITRDGLWRAQDWVKRCGARTVEWAAMPYDPFFNVNTPADLAEAQRLAREFGL